MASYVLIWFKTLYANKHWIIVHYISTGNAMNIYFSHFSHLTK